MLQAIGDGGQGWGNAILYIFLSPVIRQRLIGEWCGRCVENLDDNLNRVSGVSADPDQNHARYKSRNRNGILKTNLRDNKHVNVDNSSETAPLNPADRATGYNIRNYDTTTSFETGTDIST